MLKLIEKKNINKIKMLKSKINFFIFLIINFFEYFYLIIFFL